MAKYGRSIGEIARDASEVVQGRTVEPTGHASRAKHANVLQKLNVWLWVLGNSNPYALSREES